MQLQVMERVEEQERELKRLSALLVEHQSILRTSPERPQKQSPQTSPPCNLAPLRSEVEEVLPGTVNTVRGVADRAGELPVLRRDAFEDILAEAEEALATPQRRVRFDYAGLVFQSWLKDIWVYILKRHLSQWEAIQLVKDYTSEQARSEVEYYLGLTPKEEQSFQRLIDHLSLAFQSCKTVSSLIADFYNQSQKIREPEDAFADEL